MMSRDLVPRLTGVRGPRAGGWFDARCPAHDDQRQSFSFKDGDRGLIVTCHAGCALEAIAAALGVRVAALFHGNGGGPRIAATYEYTDEAGQLLYQVVRFEPKDFRCRRPDGAGGWHWTLHGVRVVPYRLPDLPEAPRVYVSEGEKDVDTLVSHGVVATTNHGGAGHWRDAHTQALVAAVVPEVIVLRHHDPPGTAHQQAVARACAAAGLRVKCVELPGLPDGHGEDVSDWLAAGHTIAELEALADQAPVFVQGTATVAPDPPTAAYLEPFADFISQPDPPLQEIFPELLPQGVIMLLHGEARARKSLVAFELALSAATGTAPFGLQRWRPPEPVTVVYVQQEDSRHMTRLRLRRLAEDRCGERSPDRLHVSVRRGVDLDDPDWVARLIVDLLRLDAKLLVLDAARRLSAKTDEGPSQVRELTAVLRRIVDATGVSIIIVHHDVKPSRDQEDARRRGHRASGGDWFAAAEGPVHIERLDASESLIFPEDYKYSADPAPATFRCVFDGKLIRRLVGKDSTKDKAATAGQRGQLLAWLQKHGPAPRTAMKKAGFRWGTLGPLIEDLLDEGLIDSTPGKKKDSLLYFATQTEPFPSPGNGGQPGTDDAP
jgi:putative DNA primase/helicase